MSVLHCDFLVLCLGITDFGVAAHHAKMLPEEALHVSSVAENKTEIYCIPALMDSCSNLKANGLFTEILDIFD